MLFDNLFAAADDVLDQVFAGPATYRAGSNAITLSYAAVRSLGNAQDGERDVPSGWLGYVVDLHASELVVNGQPWEPTGGDAITFPRSNGPAQTYRVCANDSGRCSEPLDTDGRKILVFVKFIRTE